MILLITPSSLKANIARVVFQIKKSICIKCYKESHHISFKDMEVRAWR
jgi:hypothetical protein